MLKWMERQKKKWMYSLGWALIILVLSGMLWVGSLYQAIKTNGDQTQPQKADCIIVMGAAVWSEGLSPVLQARIHKAQEVYQGGYAPFMILSGGMGRHPPSEAEAMREALVMAGIDDSILILEDRATSTLENIQYSVQLMDAHGWTSAIIVTDWFHLERSMRISRDHGISVSGAPVLDTILYTDEGLRCYYVWREIGAMTLYTWQRWFSQIKGHLNIGTPSVRSIYGEQRV